MYIAQMYCYGKDPLAVGVSGISGCMGVFAYFNQMLYAIHIPDNPTYNKTGGDDFCAFILREDGNFDGTRARLFFVLNNTQRPGYRDEVRNIGGTLGVPKAEIIRVNMAGGSVSNPLAVVVLCERVAGNTLVLKWMPDANVQWQQGGTARSGYYRNSSFTQSLRTSGAVSQGWQIVDPANSMLQTTALVAP